ncbi:MAG: hypothetical protein ACC630_00150, partial [Nitrospinota bacterium]
MFRNNSRFKNIIISGILIEISLLVIVLLGNLRNHIYPFIAVSLILSIPYFIQIHLIWKDKVDFKTKKKIFSIIILFAVIFRLTLLFSPPTLSEDINRYLWDGRMACNGINPYCFPPEAEELTDFRDDIYKDINHKYLVTFYPPLSQIIFHLAVKIDYSFYSLKLFLILFDLLTIFVIYKILIMKDQDISNTLIYAWNPLVLIEISGSGHHDSIFVFFLILSLYLFLLNRSKMSLFSLALSFLSKLTAVVMLPLYIKKIKNKEFLVFPLVIFLFYLPFILELDGLFSTIITVGSKWRFNDSIFSIINYYAGSIVVSKMIIILFFILLTIYLIYSKTDMMKSEYILIGALLILTPNLHPWYIVWIVPFLCFFKNRAWI